MSNYNMIDQFIKSLKIYQPEAELYQWTLESGEDFLYIKDKIGNEAIGYEYGHFIVLVSTEPEREGFWEKIPRHSEQYYAKNLGKTKLFNANHYGDVWRARQERMGRKVMEKKQIVVDQETIDFLLGLKEAGDIPTTSRMERFRIPTRHEMVEIDQSTNWNKKAYFDEILTLCAHTCLDNTTIGGVRIDTKEKKLFLFHKLVHKMMDDFDLMEELQHAFYSRTENAKRFRISVPEYVLKNAKKIENCNVK